MKDGMITNGDWNVFLTLKDEKLLLVKRKHPFVMLMPILITTCLGLFFISSAFVLFQEFLFSSALFITTMLLLISICVSIVTKIIIDWYFHIYILTNRKILELRYTPLTSYLVNDVMLDRVSCTEIDLRTHGFLNELIDMGDILITFDRPTSREEFILKDVQGSHALATYLTQQLLDVKQHETLYQPIWFKERQTNKVT